MKPVRISRNRDKVSQRNHVTFFARFTRWGGCNKMTSQACVFLETETNIPDHVVCRTEASGT